MVRNPYREGVTDRLGQTKYEHIADVLRDRILLGEWEPGTRLPSEPQLASEMGVSRATARKAIAILAKEGLLVVSHGLGTFAQFARARQSLDRLEALDAVLAAEGFQSTSKVVTFGFDTPSSGVRKQLELDKNDRVLHIRRLHSVDEGAIAVVDLDVPADIGHVWSRSDVERNPLYELLARSGTRVVRAEQLIRAAAASEVIAGLLRVEPGSPVLVSERTTQAEGGRAVVFAQFTFHPDRFEYRVSTDTNSPPYPSPRPSPRFVEEQGVGRRSPT